MSFQIVDFYTFLIELAFCILFLILFSSIHYSINNVAKVRNALQKNKAGNFFYFFAIGLLLSSLSFVLSQVCAKTLGTFIGLPIIILGLIFTMSFFYSIGISAGAVLPAIGWVVWAYKDMVGTNWDMIVRLMIILLYTAVNLILYLYKEKKWSYFIISLIFITGTIILYIATVNDVDLAYHSIETGLGIVSTIFFLALIKWINGTFKSITNIAINSVYANQHYLVYESLDLNFNNFIKINNLNQALVILFEINDVNNANAKQAILDSIYNAFNNPQYKTLFFKTEYNKYGLILSGKDFYINNLNQSFKGNLFASRLEKDNLYKLQTIINGIPLNYDDGTNKYKFNIKTYVSVYGVHSYDLNDLINADMYMINNEDNTTANIIKIFNSTMTEHIRDDDVNYATLIQSINLEELSISLELIEINETKQIYVFPRPFWIRKMLGNYNEIVKTLPPQTANTLLRNLAIKAIEQYTRSEYNGKYDLIIYYPWEELNTIFYSVNNAIQKIKLLGVDSNNIIYCFDCSKIKEWPRNVMKHLFEMEDRGLKYVLLNVNSLTIFNAHKPLFATLGENITKDPKKLDKAIKTIKKLKINVLSTITKQ